MLPAVLDLLEHNLSVIALHTPIPGWGCSCWKGQACLTPGKHPRLSEWKHLQERRATEAEVRAWWTRWPDANVGIITGMVSRVAVADIDVRNGGLDTLADLDAVGAVMPDDDALVETGSLGLHHYLAQDAPLTKAAPFEGIEVQADGGLVVAPPSLHYGGRRYRWLRGFGSPRETAPSMDTLGVHAHESPSERYPDGAARGRGDRRCHRGARDTGPLHSAPSTPRSPPDSMPVGGYPLERRAGGRGARAGRLARTGVGFRCLHAHCTERHVGELLDVLGLVRRRGA